MGLTVTRPVLIKAVVTESFKRLYVQDLEDAIKRADTILEQITTQIRRSELERQGTTESRPSRPAASSGAPVPPSAERTWAPGSGGSGISCRRHG